MAKGFTASVKKDDKNAKTSHNEIYRDNGKKVTLFGKHTTRSKANKELIEDSLLREPLEGSSFNP
ncbi:hypothetical protein J2N86_00400 [Legionella lytica]|uniref:Integrase n=1 Tax=Legionella lytica TaxID=96232 RepID=A0ABY4Y8L7_9GAMM|nr:hypothetical protein [Legionella lytica]USQ13846.1 hypothetical protein J2N86_00400 [Legionella lytica]